MFKKITKQLGLTTSQRNVKKFAKIADHINTFETTIEGLSDSALKAKTVEFKRRLSEGETLEDLLPEAFAVVREASKRTIGLRHYDIQMVGGVALHRGMIAEMRTGEGKTLVSTLPIYLNALEERGVHLVTVNDYLARRDARWMAPIFHFLGMSVGVLQMAARTEHGKKAFIVDLTKDSPHEDQHQLVMVPRKEAYFADITYGTTSEFGFDYLRDNMTNTLENRVQRGLHHFAIVDEIDNVLIDEARTPLIISGPSFEDAESYQKMAAIVKQLNDEDYEVDERARSVALTEIGEVHVEQVIGEPLRDPDRPEDITLEQERMLGYLEQALRAEFVYRRNKEYIVQGGKVVIVDENTGRMMPGRRWSDGLHQAIEAKENVKIQAENVTYATITIQNYYRMYKKLTGMTGTAETEEEEFHKIYELDVMVMPTNLDYQAGHSNYDLQAKTDVDEDGYEFTYYLPGDAKKDAPPSLFKRKDYPDVVFRTEEAKFRAIGSEILRYHAMGRPILLGTTSVELSDTISERIKADVMRKLAQVLVLRDAWFEANEREEDGRTVNELEFMNVPINLLPIKDMRKLAREVGVNINPLHDDNIDRLARVIRLETQYKDRLKETLQKGITHQVLNARKHTEESQIIARAGEFGALTIATNMAGRGVDIKLGGELPEEILSTVNRVLRRADYDDPFNMTVEEREEALKHVSEEDIGLYSEEVSQFFRHMEESRLVKKVGGLHVVGTERHDSRRIDNQLRGRAGRQGDPGSSRFYLSMQDHLMRLFGGQQAEGMMERLKVDEMMPIEMGMVSRIVEQSQTRVEGANFDTRKHLLEYDDVLNKQREVIYSQRDRIFLKEDLSEDVLEMLEMEVNRRAPEAAEDEQGPWKLIAYLTQTQPPLQFGNILFPTYYQRLLLEHVSGQLENSDKQQAKQKLLEITEDALEAEEEHLINNFASMLNNSQDRVETQLRERLETLDMFIEGLALEDETDTRSPKDLLGEATALLRVPFRMDNREMRNLQDDPDQAAEELQAQTEAYMFQIAARRLIGSVERRLEENLDINVKELTTGDWDAFSAMLLEQVNGVYDKRHKRLIGEAYDGLIARDLDRMLEQLSTPLQRKDITSMIIQIPQGQKATFDKRTRRRVWQRTQRLSFTYYTANLVRDKEEEDLRQDVLEHLKTAQNTLQNAWGLLETEKLANTDLGEVSTKTRQDLEAALNRSFTPQELSEPVRKLSQADKSKIASVLGKIVTTELYRQLMLSVISNLWIDYLTQMEALRVSVGLEAYGQRDPLVKYKSQASEMFQKLIADVRTGVVSRMFTFRPRETGAITTRDKTAEGVEAAAQTNGTKATANTQKEPAMAEANSDGGKKRRRRRRRKR